MRRMSLAVCCVALMPFAALAQTASSPVSDAVRTVVARQTKNILAAAQAMPAEKYSFRPTPDQMTFGHLMLHIVGEDTLLCSKISGMPVPTADKVADTDPKDKIVATLQASIDFCTQALAKADDSNLGEQLPLFGGHMATRAQAMVSLAADLEDHYSLAATELRLSGITPPSAVKR
jgi:DinB family protein